MSFDAIAPAYDATFTDRPLGRLLRDLVRRQLPFQRGETVLELGAGTGADAAWLAGRGVRVVATDAAEQMLAHTRQRVPADVPVLRFDLNQPDWESLQSFTPFDGVFANFGVWNCAANRPAIITGLAERVRPGGRVVLVVMGRHCLWEIGWHLLHAEPRRAFRRWRDGRTAHAGAGETVRVWYPSARHTRREFEPAFRHIATRNAGAWLPPSYLADRIERYPRTLRRLAWLDQHTAHSDIAAALSDHYLIEMERT
jgi:ubiquinone/menaquinone biosynthesis C-methylase UbiE